MHTHTQLKTQKHTLLKLSFFEPVSLCSLWNTHTQTNTHTHTQTNVPRIFYVGIKAGKLIL